MFPVKRSARCQVHGTWAAGTDTEQSSAASGSVGCALKYNNIIVNMVVLACGGEPPFGPSPSSPEMLQGSSPRAEGCAQSGTEWEGYSRTVSQCCCRAASLLPEQVTH